MLHMLLPNYPILGQMNVAAGLCRLTQKLSLFGRHELPRIARQLFN